MSYSLPFANICEISERIDKNVEKFNINFVKFTQNHLHFLVVGKYMGPILGQNLANRWVSFNFPYRGTSLSKKVMSLPHGPPPYYKLLGEVEGDTDYI